MQTCKSVEVPIYLCVQVPVHATEWSDVRQILLSAALITTARYYQRRYIVRRRRYCNEFVVVCGCVYVSVWQHVWFANIYPRRRRK